MEPSQLAQYSRYGLGTYLRVLPDPNGLGCWMLVVKPVKPLNMLYYQSAEAIACVRGRRVFVSVIGFIKSINVMLCDFFEGHAGQYSWLQSSSLTTIASVKAAFWIFSGRPTLTYSSSLLQPIFLFAGGRLHRNYRFQRLA
ncbi:hypothetical protein D9757_014014 [Collybiopsis confluens]|uniref:Uncharacterized protein n=1 Tax=Collybiopsis confluens TaxID=2823264 RepID=A0A8H5D894_9AGAR|nr:hypothetical protein D9757_014014 [Collybiopsis confluens]